MNQEVSDYIQKLPDWQKEVCESLCKLINKTVPTCEERLQYGKPHFLKNGHYMAVIHAGKDKISCMMFNTKEVPEIKGLLRSMGNGERKTVDIIEGQTVDYNQLAEFLTQVSTGL